MQSRFFDPVKSPLCMGTNLIEASAGTGKTYAIAMLYLRFVVEQGLEIDQVLAVTFTKAATEELRYRVRQRLADAKRALAGHSNKLDGTVVQWLETLDIEPALIRQRLELALLNIDRAGIFTIHGFCQRILKEHALESGQLFDAELTSELAVIKQVCADDFWRRQIYSRPLWEVSVLTAEYKTPDALLASVDTVAPHISVYPEAEDLDVKLEELKRLADQAKSELDPTAKILTASFADEKFKPSYSETFEFHYQQLHDWLHGCTAEIPAAESFALMTHSGLMAALNGNKFKANKGQTADERKSAYLAELAINTGPFDVLAKAFDQIPLMLRRTLLETLHLDMEKRLQQLNLLSFDNLISRLSDALQGDNGNLLTSELRQRFKAALIDEFQDTDASQWHIFSTLFAASSQYLYLIGDPKQAIYKFRGADIYAYLSAQSQAQHRFTLGQNWRSHPKLVHAVNSLFRRESAFLLEHVEFHAAEPARSADDGELHLEGQATAPMMLWQLPESDSKHGYWTAGKAAEAIRLAVANEVADLLNEAYTLAPDNRKLHPSDIAILVRTNTQAREYQSALSAAGIPAVINSTESVFISQEAADLLALLQAVAHPGDTLLLRQALALDWFGLDGRALVKLGNDEILLDAWLSRFAGYYQDWQQQGLMAMMLHLLAQERVRPHLSKTASAERRIASLHHLIELVQQAAVDGHLGVIKTLDWLHSAITSAYQGISSSEDQQVRLESDDDAVRVITMHRAKGLEYPVVFCPCLWQRSDRLSRENRLIKCHEQGRMIADLGSDQFERRRSQALTEELAEDLRILYVAVTRAKYRCYLVWADARSEHVANASALAWLQEFADDGFAGQQAKFKALCESAPASFAFRMLAVPGRIDRHYRKPAAIRPLQSKSRQRSLYTDWQMSSYTALSALSLIDAPELPADKAGEIQLSVEPAPTLLPRGTNTGNLVHELLETNSFAELAQGKDISLQRDQCCRRYGLKLERPELIDELLHAVVATPLSDSEADFCLMNINDSRCLKEMPFYLSMRTMDASHINRILEGTPAFQSLTSKAMSGYLTGFIDLICEFQGRYYVMDYKTNALDGYSRPSLTEAMREHNYGLQYWLYTLVLHRYLHYRLPDYRYETHFGGVRYLFVRGMRSDVPMSGVYQDRPDFDRLNALSRLFGS